VVGNIYHHGWGNDGRLEVISREIKDRGKAFLSGYFIYSFWQPR